MLKIYLSSVIIYMIIISCLCFLFHDAIKKNGWASTEKPNVNKLTALFVLSAVPLLRIYVVGLFIYMATHTKEQFEKWQEEVKKKSHED